MAETDDISIVFEKIRKHFDGKGESEHKMFHTLVDTALKYRDELASSGEKPISVDETKKALDGFMKIIVERKFPDDIDDRSKGLVLRWLEELKKHKQN